MTQSPATTAIMRLFHQGNHAPDLSTVLDIHPPEWTRDALCAQVDPDLWFPEKGGSTREAKKVCGGCEVRAECLEYALDNNEAFGVWGGASENQRNKMLHVLHPERYSENPCAECPQVFDTPNGLRNHQRYCKPQAAA